MTKLNSKVVRETAKFYGSRPVVVTLSPAGSQNEALLGLRLKGQRTQYVLALSDVYRQAALSHGRKEALAKREARRNGISWRTAKKQFLKENSLP